MKVYLLIIILSGHMHTIEEFKDSRSCVQALNDVNNDPQVYGYCSEAIVRKQ